MNANPRVAACLVVLALTACGTQPPAMNSPSMTRLSSQVPAAIEAKLREIGPVVAPPATAALYAPLQQKEPYAEAKVSRDERYGPDARHRLDVFAPTSAGAASNRPVLVFVHGGAFVAGDKRTSTSPFYDNLMLWAAKNGIVGVNMTYRLAPQHTWPAAQEDIRQALTWVRQHIAKWGGDPARVYIAGHSAGAAHVALYVGNPPFHVAPGGGLAGAIMLSGLYNTPTAQVNPPLLAYFGKDPSLYASRTALPGMLASSVPMMITTAELDPQDFHNQAKEAQAALCQAGRCPAAFELLGHSHMSEIYAPNTDDRALSDRLLAFVRAAR